MKDCVHQLRLWNPSSETRIYIILDSFHENTEFWTNLVQTYSVTLIYTSTLEKTVQHKMFIQYFNGDKSFRDGYWQKVKERFFYIEELMARDSLVSCIAMEYDVLVYCSLTSLIPLLEKYTNKLSFVMDAHERGHPGFMYVPTANSIGSFNEYILNNIKNDYEDMQLLSRYSNDFPEKVSFLPLISSERNARIPKRCSEINKTPCTNSDFLSAGFDKIGHLFDSLVVGQWLGGIDPRNYSLRRTVGYRNEGALYSIDEMSFLWKRECKLWTPILDGIPLATIHVHSKALYCFLSDSIHTPNADYDILSLKKSLLQN